MNLKVSFNILRKFFGYTVNYTSFGEALSACESDAYQNATLISVVRDKNIIYRQSSAANKTIELSGLKTLLPFALLAKSKNLRVLDFGGGGGSHYTTLKVVLGDRSNIRWNVVETPQMVRGCRILENNELKFFDDIQEARGHLDGLDLVFTSSALQYCNEPLSVLRELVDLEAPHLFLSRTPFIETPRSEFRRQVSLLSNNGPGPLPKGYKDAKISYPLTFVSREAVEKIIREKYEISFTLDEGSYKYFRRQTPLKVYGYFCTLKGNSFDPEN